MYRVTGKDGAGQAASCYVEAADERGARQLASGKGVAVIESVQIYGAAAAAPRSAPPSRVVTWAIVAGAIVALLGVGVATFLAVAWKSAPDRGALAQGSKDRAIAAFKEALRVLEPLRDYAGEPVDVKSLTDLQVANLIEKELAWARGKVGQPIARVPVTFSDARTDGGKLRLTFFSRPGDILLSVEYPAEAKYLDYWGKAKKDSHFVLSGSIDQLTIYGYVGEVSTSKYYTVDVGACRQFWQAKYPQLYLSVDVASPRIEGAGN